MLDVGGNVRGDLFRPDHLHMNARGYAVWRDALRPLLFQQGKTPTPGHS